MTTGWIWLVFVGDERASWRRACGISRHPPDVRAGLAY